ISNMPMYRGLISASVDNLPIANSVADKVLCLPIYTDLNEEIVVKITKLLLGKM
ncbi:DegT/DnrJ/EryC1/StrS family aminotransferase, partial [Escherichia coli]